MSDICVDVRLYSNIYYTQGKFYIPSEIRSSKDPEYIDYFVYDKIEKYDILIENNVLMVKTLHSCFGHALIDHVFPIHWTMNDIDSKKDFQVMFRKRQYDENICKTTARINSDRIDTNKGMFKPFYNPEFNTYQDMMELITPYPLMFEHLLDNNKVYCFKNLYCYLGCYNNVNRPRDEYQRTPWNLRKYWPERGHRVDAYTLRLRRSDEEIYSNLMNYIIHVKNKYEIKQGNTLNCEKKRVVILGRREKNNRGGRGWDNELLDFMINTIKDNDKYVYGDILYLEDYNFEDQVREISKINIIISKHGSGLSNMIWLPLNSKIIEFDVNVSGKFDRQFMHKRIAQATNSEHVWFPLGPVDYNIIKKSLTN